MIYYDSEGIVRFIARRLTSLDLLFLFMTKVNHLLPKELITPEVPTVSSFLINWPLQTKPLDDRTWT